MAKITKCDKCGRDISLSTGHMCVRLCRGRLFYTAITYDRGTGSECRYDLCAKCAEALKKFIKSEGTPWT